MFRQRQILCKEALQKCDWETLHIWRRNSPFRKRISGVATVHLNADAALQLLKKVKRSAIWLSIEIFAKG